MPLIEWTDELSIGIKEIDAEHKKLIELVNSLCEEIGLADTHELGLKRFDNLYTHTKNHFETEEELMVKHQYPRSALHIGEHNNLLQKVKSIRYLYSVNDQTVISSLASIFKDWFLRHFDGEDKSLAMYLNNKGVIYGK